jgi:hypothetical protein
VLRPLQRRDSDFEFRSRNACISAYLCIVLSYVGTGIAMGQAPIQEVLPKFLNWFILTETASELEQNTWPNKWRRKQINQAIFSSYYWDNITKYFIYIGVCICSTSKIKSHNVTQCEEWLGSSSNLYIFCF